MNYLGGELSKFSEQIRFALNNYSPHGVRKSDLKNIILCGLGGSGIAGRVIKNYFYDKIDLPIELVSDYTLPSFAGEGTLVILCSYSGNTEETLACYKSAKDEGCKVICITCGGTLGELAAKDGNISYKAVPGFQPRVAFGYPMTYYVLVFSELLGLDKKAELKSISELMDNVNDFKRESASLLEDLKSTIKDKYVIIADRINEGVAIRFANQIQENAKLEAFVVILPEGNHNVIETYYYKQNSNFILLNSGTNQRVNLRFHFIKELLSKFDSAVIELPSTGNTLTQLVSNIFLFDWLSLQIADHTGTVSNVIENINHLKKYLERN